MTRDRNSFAVATRCVRWATRISLRTVRLAQGESVSDAIREAMVEDWDPMVFQRMLGAELQQLRTSRGWTRKALAERLSIGPQTLATYEYGTRQCAIGRLLQICLALDIRPHEVLARVHTRLFPPEPSGDLTVDLRAVVEDRQSELLPLRRWASSRLATARDHDTQLRLDPPTLDHLAHLCGLTAGELVNRLHRLNQTRAT